MVNNMMKSFEKLKNKGFIGWLSIAGYIIIIGTHIWMYFNGLPANQQSMHAIMNFIAIIAIIYERIN